MSSYRIEMARALVEIQEQSALALAAAQSDALAAARYALSALIQLDRLPDSAESAVYTALTRLNDLEEDS